MVNSVFCAVCCSKRYLYYQFNTSAKRNAFAVHCNAITNDFVPRSANAHCNHSCWQIAFSSLKLYILSNSTNYKNKCFSSMHNRNGNTITNKQQRIADRKL